MLKPVFFILFFILAAISTSALKINEIMYNPTCYSDKYCEWIELYNDEENSINISEYTLSDNTANDTLEGSFDNGGGTIIPGYGYALIVDTDTRIYNDFDINDTVIWIYTEDDTMGGSKLGNSETITLYDNNLNQVDTITYDNDVSTEGNTWSLINSVWQETSPSPGLDNIENTTTTLNFSFISISEFLPNPEGNDEDGEWVELYNSGTSSIDLLGLELYDNYGSDSDLIVTNTSTTEGTTIQANAHLVVYTNGVSGFLNNENYEKITLKDIYGNILDEVTYSGSDEAVSWSLSEGEWQKTTPTPGYENGDNASSVESEIKIEEIYDLGSDNKAEWGDIIRPQFYIYKGNTNKNVVWIWIEDSGTRITKKSKFNLYSKFQNYTFTYPIAIPDNCDEEFDSGNYKVIASGIDASAEKIVEIRDRPLCKDFNRKPRVKSFEYEIASIPKIVYLEESFTTEVKLKNNEKEDINLDVWSFPYSGKKKFVEKDEKENLKSLILLPSEEKTIKLNNYLNETTKKELKFKIKIQRSDRKNPLELRDAISVIPTINPTTPSKTPSKTLLNSITGLTIYEGSGQKAKRSAVFLLTGALTLITVYLTIRKWN